MKSEDIYKTTNDLVNVQNFFKYHEDESDECNNTSLMKKIDGLCKKFNVKMKECNTENLGSLVYELAHKYNKLYGWAFADKNAVKNIKKFVGKENILEVGAGLGMYAFLLLDDGVNIVATDIKHTHYIDEDGKEFTKVEELDYKEALHKYDCPVLMLIWPPNNDDMANNALKLFNGNKLVYIGEEVEGCTANNAFFDTLEKDWKLVKEIIIRQNILCNNSLFLYKRK